jgi:3-hydroxyacyl-CoA dehydrogenase
VAVVGTGVIGASWTACFLAQGLDVTATDPAEGAEERLRAAVASHWPALERLGIERGASRDRLRFVVTVEDAVGDADFVQESGPERAEIKQELFRRLDGSAPAGAILASSSSGLPPSAIQARCEHPGRVVVGHPFNPPHLIPLVEVVAGERTDRESVDAAMAPTRRSGSIPSAWSRSFPAISQTGCRQRFGARRSISSSVAPRRWPTSTRRSRTVRGCGGSCSVRS